MEIIAVVDFETTGMSPRLGARATEIAVVLVQGARIVGRYQSLMRSGAWVPPFIERLTGISNRMLEGAPPASQVMREVAAFVGASPMVAHNAAFDRSFWDAELERAGGNGDVDGNGGGAPGADRNGGDIGDGKQIRGANAIAAPFACTLLLSRRLNEDAPNHRLGTLAEWFDLPRGGRAHRAMADAEVTAHLLMRMQRDVERRFAEHLPNEGVTHGLLAALQRAPKKALAKCVAQYRQAGSSRARPATAMQFGC
jgi:DNA polymerase-3 subunit epsilon